MNRTLLFLVLMILFSSSVSATEHFPDHVDKFSVELQGFEPELVEVVDSFDSDTLRSSQGGKYEVEASEQDSDSTASLTWQADESGGGLHLEYAGQTWVQVGLDLPRWLDWSQYDGIQIRLGGNHGKAVSVAVETHDDEIDFRSFDLPHATLSGDVGIYRFPFSEADESGVRDVGIPAGHLKQVRTLRIAVTGATGTLNIDDIALYRNSRPVEVTGEEAILRASITRRIPQETVPFCVEYDVTFEGQELSYAWHLLGVGEPEDAQQESVTLLDEPSSTEEGPILLVESNAYDFDVLLVVTDKQGTQYEWRDEGIDIPLHSQTEIRLDASRFVPADQIESVKWIATNGDPDDDTFPIAENESMITELKSEWPNVFDIECIIERTDGSEYRHNSEALLCFRDGPPWPVRATAATFYGPFYGDDLDCLLDEAFSTLAGLGFNSVVSAINWWYCLPNESGTFTLGPVYKANYDNWDTCGYTAADEQLQALFGFAESTGFSVNIQMLQYPCCASSDDSGISHDFPAHGGGPNEGFRNTDGFLYGDGQGYEAMLLNYIPLFASSEAIGTIFLGAEIENMEVDGGERTREFFDGVIGSYRSAGISTPLSYALNCSNNVDGPGIPPFYLENLEPGVCGIPWGSMDYVSLTFYPKLVDSSSASTDDMYAAALRQVDQYLLPLHETYGKPLFIADFYCFAHDGCAVDPLRGVGQPSQAYDFEEQRRWHTAWLRAFSTLNQDAGYPVIEGLTMGTYRMMPNELVGAWLSESDRLGGFQLNQASGRPDLQKLAAAWFRDVPLYGD